MKKIVLLMGSYRKNGINNAIADFITTEMEIRAEIIRYDLIDQKIEFCTNCRACTQIENKVRGLCVINDDMSKILSDIDSADGIVMMAPTNYFGVNAITQKFLERCVVYAYWPWGQYAPKYRIKNGNKKIILIPSTAMPGFFARFFTHSMSVLSNWAKSVGARPIAKIHVGTVSQSPAPILTGRLREKIKSAVLKL